MLKLRLGFISSIHTLAPDDLILGNLLPRHQFPSIHQYSAIQLWVSSQTKPRPPLIFLLGLSTSSPYSIKDAASSGYSAVTSPGHSGARGRKYRSNKDVSTRKRPLRRLYHLNKDISGMSDAKLEPRMLPIEQRLNRMEGYNSRGKDWRNSRQDTPQFSVSEPENPRKSVPDPQ